MSTRGWLAMIVALVGCTDRTPARQAVASTRSPIGSVEEVRNVSISAGFRTWRGSTVVESQAGLLVRLAGRSPSIPGAATNTLWVLGDSIAVELVPADLNHLVLLFLPQPANVDVNIFATSGLTEPDRLTGVGLTEQRQAALASGLSWYTLRTPFATAPITPYTSLGALQYSEKHQIVGPSECRALTGKDCGIFVDEQPWPLECVCGTGQECVDHLCEAQTVAP